MSAVSFTVHGVAAPAGSKRGFVKGGRVVITDDSKRSRPWKAQVADAAFNATGHETKLLEGALSLRISFYMPRPKGHHGKRGLLPSAPAYPTVKPDVSKLVRAVEDALTGVVWRDDAQVIDQFARKHYGEPARCEVYVEEIHQQNERGVA